MKKTVCITYAFIDASNIIYGTRDEGWKVDFRKLFKYLTQRHQCKKVYYFAGLEKNNFKQDGFYKVLDKIGYRLVLKPVKIYRDNVYRVVRKANCDVDLTYYVMKNKEKFDKAIFFTGDGDFIILFNHLIQIGKQIQIIANGKRTAKEIRKLMGPDFVSLESIREIIRYK